jgi:hypothetical protein
VATTGAAAIPLAAPTGFVVGGVVGALVGGLVESRERLAATASVLHAEGLSAWDKIRLKIKIAIGAILTEGEVKKRLDELERLREEQVQEMKERDDEDGEGAGNDGDGST